MSCRDVAHVEGRILAHQDHVDGRELDRLERAQRVMSPVLAAHFQTLAFGGDPAVLEAQMPRQIVIKRMAARLGLERQHEGRVRVDVDGVDGIHLDGDDQTHVPRSSAIRLNSP